MDKLEERVKRLEEIIELILPYLPVSICFEEDMIYDRIEKELLELYR